MKIAAVNYALLVAIIHVSFRAATTAKAAEVSGNFILQLKQVPGYVMPDASDDPYHTKAFFCSSVELFLTQTLKKEASAHSKFSLLDIYKVEINNQVVGKAIGNITAEDASFMFCPLYVNMTISGEYTPVQRKKDLIDSEEYQQVLLQLFSDYQGELAGSLRDLVHIPYFGYVTAINAIASSVLETQAKTVLDSMEQKQQKLKEKKLTAAITFMSIGGVGVLLLLIISVKVVSSRVLYNQVNINETNNGEFDVHHKASSYSSSLDRIPPSRAFGNIRNTDDPFGYSLRSHHSSTLSIPRNNQASTPSTNPQDRTDESFSSRSNEFSVSDGLTYSYNDSSNNNKKVSSKESLQSDDVPYPQNVASDGSVDGSTNSNMLAAHRQDKEHFHTSENSVGESTTTSSSSNASRYLKLRGQNYDGVKRHCFAPKGKLGIAIENGPVGVGPVVHKIKKGSPLEGILKRGDRIVGIDDADTRELSAADVTAWMVDKMDCRRKITYMTLKQGIIV